MAYISQFDSSISFDVNTGVINTNNLSLLNSFGTSETVSGYDAGSGDNTLENGESLGVSTEEGSSLTGTYLGDLTLSTISPSISVPLVGGLSVQLNPITGEMYQADSGELYMISDDPINDARIGLAETGIARRSADDNDMVEYLARNGEAAFGIAWEFSCFRQCPEKEAAKGFCALC